MVRIEPLGRENYDIWKTQIRALLIKNVTWGYVSGDIKKSASTEKVTSAVSSRSPRAAALEYLDIQTSESV